MFYSMLKELKAAFFILHFLVVPLFFLIPNEIVWVGWSTAVARE